MRESTKRLLTTQGLFVLALIGLALVVFLIKKFPELDIGEKYVYFVRCYGPRGEVLFEGNVTNLLHGHSHITFKSSDGESITCGGSYLVRDRRE